MERLSDELTFDFNEGACNTYKDSQGRGQKWSNFILLIKLKIEIHNDRIIGVEFVLLCFDREAPKKCHRYESSNQIINDISEATIDRNAIRLGNYMNQPIAVGGWYTLTGDLMSLDDDSYKWSSITEFPCYGQDCGNANLFWYASVSTPSSFIIMGGKTGLIEIRDEIVEFKKNIWGRDITFITYSL